MLVLSRKIGERIYIGHNQEIEIVVVEIDRNKIRLGVIAPRDIPVFRDNVANRPIPTPPVTTDRRPS